MTPIHITDILVRRPDDCSVVTDIIELYCIGTLQYIAARKNTKTAYGLNGAGGNCLRRAAGYHMKNRHLLQVLLTELSV